LDQNQIKIPLESFPPIQPPNKPKYTNKAHKCGAGAAGQGLTSQHHNTSFISATGDGPDAAAKRVGTLYSKGGMAHGHHHSHHQNQLNTQLRDSMMIKQ